jgi:hypothetical protein
MVTLFLWDVSGKFNVHKSVLKRFGSPFLLDQYLCDGWYIAFGRQICKVLYWTACEGGNCEYPWENKVGAIGVGDQQNPVSEARAEKIEPDIYYKFSPEWGWGSSLSCISALFHLCRRLCFSFSAENITVSCIVHNEVGREQLFDVYRPPFESCSLPAHNLFRVARIYESPFLLDGCSCGRTRIKM